MRQLDGTARVFRANIFRPGSNDFVDGFDPKRSTRTASTARSWTSSAPTCGCAGTSARTTLHSITGYENVEVYSRGDIDGGSVYTFDFFGGDG